MTPRPSQPRTLDALRRWTLIAVTGGAALALASYLLVITARGQRIDVAALESLRLSWPDSTWVNSLLMLVTPGLVALAALVCLVGGLFRRRLDLALGAVATLAGANVTTRLLKLHVLPRPDLGLPSGVVGPENSLPSGHTTATMAFVAAAMLVTPAAWRRVAAAVGASWVSFVGYSMVAVGGHRPSDIAAAVGVGLIWGAAGVVVAAAVQRLVDVLPQMVAEWVDPVRPSRDAARPVLVAALLGSALAELVVVAAGVVVRPGLRHMAAAFGIGVVIAGLVSVAVTWLARGAEHVADGEGRQERPPW